MLDQFMKEIKERQDEPTRGSSGSSLGWGTKGIPSLVVFKTVVSFFSEPDRLADMLSPTVVIMPSLDFETIVMFYTKQ